MTPQGWRAQAPPEAARPGRLTGGKRRWLTRRQTSPPRRSLPHACDAARGPEPSVPRRGRAARVEGTGDQGGFFEASALEAADQAACLGGAAAIERSASIGARRRMGAPMPPHQEVEFMRSPATPGRPQPLTVQRRGKAGIGGHARLAEFVEEEAQMGGTAGAVPDVG
jgi:hypothetical protein